jgi:putative FmdB family regulatory protein
MPVYEYLCDNCNERFDARVRNFDAADSVSCRTCSSPTVRRLISTFAVGGLDDPITPLQTSNGSGGCCGGSCGCCG